MSKFLKLIEENKPGEGPFTVEYKDKDGNLMATVTLPNDVGSSYENFLKFAEESGGHLNVEDNEAKDQVDTINAIVSLPDQSLGGRLTSRTKRNLQAAKRKMSSAALKIADKFDKAAGK
jgi:hypothetical protein|tara:strand:+ start:306 stop:662 length:357 start_codon:yes stop_codon:yes gene_type:complete